MKKVVKELADNGYKTKLLLQVHDELVFESPLDEVAQVKELIKNVMESVANFDIPFIAAVESGDNWAEAH